MIREPPLARELVPYELATPESEVALPANASPLDFLCAVFRDTGQPMARRMRAAEAAAPFVHPKLAVTATLDGGFADRLEAALKRSSAALAEPTDGRMTNPEGPGDLG